MHEENIMIEMYRLMCQSVADYLRERIRGRIYVRIIDDGDLFVSITTNELGRWNYVYRGYERGINRGELRRELVWEGILKEYKSFVRKHYEDIFFKKKRV